MSEAAADIFANLAWGEDETLFCGHLASDPLGFPLLKKGRGVAWNLDEAVLGGGIAHVDKAQGAAVEGFPNVPAKPAVGNFEALTSRQVPIKPGRPIAAGQGSDRGRAPAQY